MKTLRPAHALSLLVLRFVHGKAARLAVWRYPRNKNAGIRTALAINANLQSNLREFESALWERKRVFHTVNCTPRSNPYRFTRFPHVQDPVAALRDAPELQSVRLSWQGLRGE